MLVLDDAPGELVRLVGYLETVTADRLLIDLVTVSAYDVNGTQILVPQRVEPERRAAEATVSLPDPSSAAEIVPGVDEFAASIKTAPAERQPFLSRICEWARTLEGQHLARLSTRQGKTGDATLFVYVPGDSCLVTVVNGRNAAYMRLWRSVFEKLTSASLPRVEEIFGLEIRRGTSTREAGDALLQALAGAYKEAATARVAG